jgi:hypothetical protein
VRRDTTFVAGISRLDSGIRARVATARGELGERLE